MKIQYEQEYEQHLYTWNEPMNCDINLHDCEEQYKGRIYFQSKIGGCDSSENGSVKCARSKNRIIWEEIWIQE